jgi:hypothetical protein
VSDDSETKVTLRITVQVTGTAPGYKKLVKTSARTKVVAG